MNYYFTKKTTLGFDEAVTRLQAELKREGFGILTEIDMQDTLKKKLNVDIRRYRIMGACNPPYANRALQAEDYIGTMLPCNVIVQEREDGHAEVSSINPLVNMQAIGNPKLDEIASEIAAKLKAAIERV